MLPLLFIFALCSLLSPSQAEEKAAVQISMCKGAFEKLFTDALRGNLLNLNPLNELLSVGEQKNGGGGLFGSSRLLGGILNKVSSVAGIRIIDASLLELVVTMPNNVIEVEISTCLVLEIDAKLPALSGLQGLSDLPLLGSGKIIISVDMNTKLVLRAEKNERNNFQLCLENCKLLDIKIKVKGSGLADTLGSVANSVTNVLDGVVGGIVNPLICNTVLPTVLNLVNRKLALVGGLLPVGGLGDHLEYVFKDVKEIVGNCLIFEVNALYNYKLIHANTGNLVEIPPLREDGVVIHGAFLNEFITEMKNVNIKLTKDEVAYWCSDATEPMDLFVAMERGSEIALEENNPPRLKINIRVIVRILDSGMTAFQKKWISDVDLSVSVSSDGFIIIKVQGGDLDVRAARDVQPNENAEGTENDEDPTIKKSICKKVIERSEEFNNMCGLKIMKLLNGRIIRIPLPQCGMKFVNSSIVIKKDCVVVRAKQPIKKV